MFFGTMFFGVRIYCRWWALQMNDSIVNFSKWLIRLRTIQRNLFIADDYLGWHGRRVGVCPWDDNWRTLLCGLARGCACLSRCCGLCRTRCRWSCCWRSCCWRSCGWSCCRGRQCWTGAQCPHHCQHCSQKMNKSTNRLAVVAEWENDENCKYVAKNPLVLFQKVRTHTLTHTKTHTHAHTHRHTHTHTHTHTRTRTNAQTNSHTLTHTNKLVHMYIHSHTHTNKLSLSHTHTNNLTHTHTHTHKRARAHTHRHGSLSFIQHNMWVVSFQHKHRLTSCSLFPSDRSWKSARKLLTKDSSFLFCGRVSLPHEVFLSGHAHTAPPSGVAKQRWEQPPLLTAQMLVPASISKERARVFNNVIDNRWIRFRRKFPTDSRQ